MRRSFLVLSHRDQRMPPPSFTQGPTGGFLCDPRSARWSPVSQEQLRRGCALVTKLYIWLCIHERSWWLTLVVAQFLAFRPRTPRLSCPVPAVTCFRLSFRHLPSFRVRATASPSAIAACAVRNVLCDVALGGLTVPCQVPGSQCRLSRFSPFPSLCASPSVLCCRWG